MKGHTKAVLAFLIGAGIMLAVGLGLYADGKDATHMEGLDFDNYLGYFVLEMIVFFTLIGIFGWLAVYLKRNDRSRGVVVGIVVLLSAIMTPLAVAQVLSLGRAFSDNSSAADIQIDTAASGDFQINSAQVEAYHDKDTAFPYKFLRVVSYDDKYRMYFEINCTNFTNSTQYYNSTTATLEGFNLRRESVTGKLSPVSQPGDFDEHGPKNIEFSDVPRNLDSVDKQIVYFNLTLLNSDGELLANWIVHTDPSLSYWTLDAQV